MTEHFYFNIWAKHFICFTSCIIKVLWMDKFLQHSVWSNPPRDVDGYIAILPVSHLPGSPALWYSWKVVMQCQIVAFLWSAVTRRIPRERVTEGGRRKGEGGLKCCARYSKRCLINNVSERTRWDTAGLLCLSQASTRTRKWRTDQTFPPFAFA